MTTPAAIVVGGGLAGMVVARELALRRWRVMLLERSARLGGKASADRTNGRLVEHGYHVFSQWYPNVWAIVDRLGVRLIDFDRYHFLLPGAYPRRITVDSRVGARWQWTTRYPLAHPRRGESAGCSLSAPRPSPPCPARPQQTGPLSSPPGPLAPRGWRAQPLDKAAVEVAPGR